MSEGRNFAVGRNWSSLIGLSEKKVKQQESLLWIDISHTFSIIAILAFFMLAAKSLNRSTFSLQQYEQCLFSECCTLMVQIKLDDKHCRRSCVCTAFYWPCSFSVKKEQNERRDIQQHAATWGQSISNALSCMLRSSFSSCCSRPFILPTIHLTIIFL